MSNNTSTKTVTASDARAWMLGHPSRTKGLSDKALANLRATRGPLSREVVTRHNKRRKAQYPVANVPTGRPLTTAGKARRQAEADAKALRESARAAGFKVGDRGRIPAQALAALKG